MATVSHELAKIFQSQRDRLRNADEPHMMRPKQDRKPLKGVARTLYLNRYARLSKAQKLADSFGAVGWKAVKGNYLLFKRKALVI